jgi:hypothetical protein
MLVESHVERTTAATDALLGLLCVGLLLQLAVTPTDAGWKRQMWVGVLTLMACGAFLGAAAHGLTLTGAARTFVWRPLYLTLGLAVALVVVAAAYDWAGEAAARRLLPWATAAGVLFFLATEFLGGGFLLFVVYEAAGTIAALAIYLALSVRGSLPGAPAIAAGLALSVLAAVVQRTSLRLQAGVVFDHNGLFHLIQMAAIVVIAVGVRVSLTSASGLHP